jgi:RNA polymerase sigma factor (sigma-70 family)
VIFDNLDKTMAQLYRYSLMLTRSPWAAEDLVQETLIKVYTIKKTDPQREFTNSFLYTVAKNLFIDEQRKKKAFTTFREELHQYEVDYTGCESIVEELLLKLPIRQAILITLKDVFGYHSQEIAAMLRVTDESVKTALSRTRSRLKKLSKDIPQIHHQPTDKELILELTRAIKQGNPASLFSLCRLLESRNYSLSRVSGTRYMHVIDPDGNVLEITCCKLPI